MAFDAPPVADSSFAHAEMDALYRLGPIDTEEAAGWTLYSSLEPCLMCGGAVGMVGLHRVVWACDDPWGGSGRLIAWNEHPAYTKIEVSACPFPDLEREAAELFAVEARRVYPPEAGPSGRSATPRSAPAPSSFLAEVPEKSRQTRGSPPTHPNPPTLD
jgi:tRNA(adenine34) deaminase